MTKPPTKPKLIDLCKPGLAGRCFIVRDERGSTKYQGFVHCIIPSQQGDLVLIQYFEAMFGQPHTMALVTLASMVEEKDRGPWADYVFFEDDEQLRAYMENVQNRRDERLAEEEWAKAKEPTA